MTVACQNHNKGFAMSSLVAALAPFLAPVIQLDNSIAILLNQHAAQDINLDRLIYNIADSAIFKGGLFMAFFWWQWFRRDEATPERRGRIITALAGGIIAIAFARALQILLPFRNRPIHNAELQLTLPHGMDGTTLDGWSSFPSDHAVLFFALAAAVWRLNRGVGAAALLWTAVMICLPRMYLGYHFFTDILAGAVIGILTMQATFVLLRPRFLAQPLLRWEAAHSTSFYCLAFLASLELAVLFQDVRHLVTDSVQMMRMMQSITATAAETAT